MAELAIWKALLVLFFGAPPLPGVPQGPLRACLPREVQAYAEIDVSGLRRLAAETPELQALLYGGDAPAASYERAAAQLARVLRTRPEQVKLAAESLRRVAFWLLAFGEEEESLRMLAVFDCGEARDVLPGLLRGFADAREYSTYAYAGGAIHALADRSGRGLWLAEREGLVALALDPLVVREFLLARGPAPEAPATGSEQAPALVRLEGNVPALVDRVLAYTYDREEFFTPAALFDLASWKRVTVTFDGRRLTLKLRLDAAGRLAKALAGPGRPPALLSAVPAHTALAGVLPCLPQRHGARPGRRRAPGRPGSRLPGPGARVGG